MKKVRIVICVLVAIMLMLGTVQIPVYAASKAKLNKSSITLKVKQTYQLKLKNSKGKVAWSSSNKKVAKVTSKGKVTAIKAGKAIITAKNNKKKYTCKVTVKNTEKLPTIPKKVIWSGNDVIISTTGLTYSQKDGYKVGINVKNNSELSLAISAHSFAVNGIMCGGTKYGSDFDVASGKQANYFIQVKPDFIKQYNIKTFDSMDVLFWAYDNAKHYKEFETDVVTIKSSTGNDNQVIKGKSVYNEDGIELKYIGFEKGEAKFVLVNKYGEYINFTAKDISVNDYTIGDYDYNWMDTFDEQILNNNQYVFTIKPDASWLKDNGIKKMTKITLSLKIEPLDDWRSEFMTEEISITL